MRELSGADIRREYNQVMKALSEKFLRDDDASIVVSEFIEKATLILTRIREMYNKESANRESIIKSVLDSFEDLEVVIEKAENKLQNHLAVGEPEDNNRSIDRS